MMSAPEPLPQTGQPIGQPLRTHHAQVDVFELRSPEHLVAAPDPT